jgi:hypothetical protein
MSAPAASAALLLAQCLHFILLLISVRRPGSDGRSPHRLWQLGDERCPDSAPSRHALCHDQPPPRGSDPGQGSFREHSAAPLPRDRNYERQFDRKLLVAVNRRLGTLGGASARSRLTASSPAGTRHITCRTSILLPGPLPPSAPPVGDIYSGLGKTYPAEAMRDRNFHRKFHCMIPVVCRNRSRANGCAWPLRLMPLAWASAR